MSDFNEKNKQIRRRLLAASWTVPVVLGVSLPSHASTSVTTTAAPTTVPPTTAPPQSDIRLKTAVELLGKTDTGHAIYRFQYLDDVNKVDYVGVMAQDLIENHSQALMMHEDGYYRVYYDRLGLKMATLEEYRQFGLSAVTLDSSGLKH